MRFAAIVALFAFPVIGHTEALGSELDQAEARWAAQNIGSYEFTFSTEMHHYTKFFPDAHVVVKNGRVLSVRSVEACCGFKKGARIPRDHWKWFVLTIPDAFFFMRNLLDQGAEGGVIPYHPVFGFPEVVSVDPEEDAHAAATYRVVDFKVRRRRLTPRWRGHVRDKVPSAKAGVRAAQLNR